MSLSGLRDLADETLDVAHTDWRKEITVAEESMKRQNMDETYEKTRNRRTHH